MNVTVVARALVCLVFLHEWDKLFGLPALSLEIIVVGGTSSSVHHLLQGKQIALNYLGIGRLTKLMLEPPPKMLATGTIARLPESHLDGREW